jgi:hypothetical protein
MTLLELMKRANQRYPEGLLAYYYDAKTGEPKKRMPNVGDTLAKFIVIELAETFDNEAPTDVQLTTAYNVLDQARSDLLAVMENL